MKIVFNGVEKDVVPWAAERLLKSGRASLPKKRKSKSTKEESIKEESES